MEWYNMFNRLASFDQQANVCCDVFEVSTAKDRT